MTSNSGREDAHRRSLGQATARLREVARRERVVTPEDFPAAAYRDTHADLAHLSDAAAFRHFLQFGVAEARRIEIDWSSHPALLLEIGRRAPALPGWTWSDARAYRNLNADLNLDNDVAATAHFAVAGCWDVRPISSEYRFDPDFYRDYYQDVRGYDVAGAYRHWLAFGRDEGRMPSGAVLCLRQHLPIDGIPEEFAPNELQPAFPELAELSRTRLFTRLFERGLPEGRAIPFASGRSGLLGALARHWTQRDETQALRFFRAAAEHDPDDAALLSDYGDLLLRQGQLASARIEYEAARRLRPKHAWTLINLGVVNERLGDHDAAMQCYEEARQTRPDWSLTRKVLLHGAASQLQQQLENAVSQAAGADRHTAAETVSQAATQFMHIARREFGVAHLHRRRHATQPRVAFVTSTTLRQCRLYRVEQKVEQADHAGDITFDVFELRETPRLLDRLIDFDVLWLYRAYVSPEALTLVAAARALGLRIVYETDDLTFHPQDYPPPYSTMESLVTKADYARLVVDGPSALFMLRLCDVAVASTASLQEQMAPHTTSGQAFLHRNGLSSLHMRAVESSAPTEHRSEKVLAFYGSGSRSHNENFRQFAGPALARVMQQDARVHLMVVGDLELGPEFADLGSRVVHLPATTNLATYWRLLQSADLNLCPLTTSGFNDAKSEIKWLEAGMLGVPSVASATLGHRESIEDGKDGLLAHDRPSWESAIGKLCHDDQLRERIGYAARQRALSEYNLPALAENLSRTVRAIAEGAESPPKDDRPRVLVVNVFYAPQSYGGATRVVEGNIADILEATDNAYAFEVFTSIDRPDRAGEVLHYSHRGVPVTAVSIPADPYVFDERNLFVEEAFQSTLQRFQPDLIHYHCIQRLTASVIDVARRSGIPYMVTVHDGWWISDEQFLLDSNGAPVYETGQWGHPRRLARLRTALEGAEHVAAVSERFAEIYRQRGVAKVVACPNGVNAIPGPVDWPAGPQVSLGLLGGIGPAKGSELLRQILDLEHFANLDIKVVDHERERDHESRVQWGLNRVTLLGAVPQSEVAQIYSRLHVVLVPSICVESFGLIAREALLLGRWVVASDRGAVAEDVQEDINGFTIDVSDGLGLLSALRRINKNPERFLQAPPTQTHVRPSSEQARDIIETYDRLLNSSSH